MNISSITIPFAIIIFKIVTSASLTIPPYTQNPSMVNFQTLSTNIDVLQPRNIIFDMTVTPIQDILDCLMKNLPIFNSIYVNMSDTTSSTNLQKNTSTQVQNKSKPVLQKNTSRQFSNRKIPARQQKKRTQVPEESIPIPKPTSAQVSEESIPLLQQKKHTQVPEENIPLPQQNTNTEVSDESIPVQNFQKEIIVKGANSNIIINGNPKYYNDEAFQKGDVHVKIHEGNFYVNDNLVTKKDPTKSSSIYMRHIIKHFEVEQFELKIDVDGMMNYTDNRGANDRVNYIKASSLSSLKN